MPYTENGARRFLGLLAGCEPGNVVLANMAAARKAGHWTALQSQHFLGLCLDLHAQKSSEDVRHAYEALTGAIANFHRQLFFSRPLTAGLDSQIALVITYDYLFPGRSVLDEWEAQNRLIFRRSYIEGVLSQGGPQDAERGSPQAMEDVIKGFQEELHPRAQFGHNQYVVFVTRADAVWDAHLATVPLKGDDLRDRLGLPYRAGSLLIGLRSSCGLENLASENIRVAAPTFMEAWRCDFFRQIPDIADSLEWGQTVHLRRLFAEETHIDGAPEAIVEMLPIAKLRQHIKLQPAGAVGSPLPATTEMHWKRLLKGRTVDQVISAVLAP